MSWWTDITATQFETKAKCMSDQYSTFAVKSELTGESLGYVNGPLTLGESIADNGGLRIAFQAYTTYMRKNAINQKTYVRNQFLLEASQSTIPRNLLEMFPTL